MFIYASWIFQNTSSAGMLQKFFSRFETFLQSNAVATSKLLILLHLVFSTIRLIFYTQVFVQNY